MRAALVLLGLLTGLTGCAVGPSRCYVTLDRVGAPTAEACETGPNLVVRPITETNAAYYVPPYVIGALAYEGFLVPAEGDAGDVDTLVATLPGANGTGDHGEHPAVVGTDVIGADLALALAADEGGKLPALEDFWEVPMLLEARLDAVDGDVPPQRLDGPSTIDGAVYYRRPRGDYPVFPLSVDLIR